MKQKTLFDTPATTGKPSMKRIQNIGRNRELPRIWIEGQCLASMGWTKGTRYDCEFHQGSITYTKNELGSRAVAGTEKRPIIDTNNQSIVTSLGEDANWVEIEISETCIRMVKSNAPPSRIKAAITAAAIFITALGSPWISKADITPKKVLVACEESATVRDAFIRRGHDAISCDLLPTRNPYGWHIQGDATLVLDDEWDLILAFPPCTFLTNSAEWAYNDPDYERYPGVGYHQRVKSGTLTGEERREARKAALHFVHRIWKSCRKVCIENPVGHLSSAFMSPTQVIQPWHFGHPESKSTCLWLKNLAPLVATNILDIKEHGWLAPSGKWRWKNQTSGGHNNLSPSQDRDKIRSTTYYGIGEAMAEQWGGDLS